jgi:hypothetical protein
MLAAILLIAIAFAGTAAPNKEFKNFPKDLPERVLLGLNDSELQDKEIPDFGPEVFERIKKEPKTLDARGKIPKFKTEKERRNWLDKLDENRISVRNDMRPYLYPSGKVIMYGWNDKGYFDVVFYENTTVEASLVNEIYAVIDKQAKKLVIDEIPVVFRIDEIPHYATDYNSYFRPVIGGITVQAGNYFGTSGFAVRSNGGLNGYVVPKHLTSTWGTQLWQPDNSNDIRKAGYVQNTGGNNADAVFVSYGNVEASIHIGGGYVVPVKGSMDPQIGWKVWKSGRATGITGGYVDGLYDTTYIDGRWYYNQARATDLLVAQGDSGAPVWYLDSNSNRQIVGIISAFQGQYTWFSKTSGVTGDLGVTILTR